MTLRMVYADGPCGPRCSPAAVLATCLTDEPTEVVLGWTPEPLDWIDDPGFCATTLLPGYGLGRAVAAGRVTPLPVRLGAVAAMWEQHPPDIAVVAGVRRGDRWAFHRSIGWADVLARVADRVVVEVAERGVDDLDLGAPLIEGNVVGTIAREGGCPPVSLRVPDEIDRRIAAHVVGLLPDDPTLQFGLGSVPDAIAASIDRPVRLWTGLLTDAMAGLHERDLLGSPAVAAYTWGGAPIGRLASDAMLELRSTAETHDIGRLARIPRLVAINAALQVGLDGSVNVERVRGRTIAGVGGHGDFSAGASRSVGGMSIVVLRSTDPSGAPTIVDEVEVVSTQRSDIDVVVTEHGIADLRGAGDAERARRLRAIA
jgi:acyl CoA:acetate/3-ketoacid CoA transferase beta subunit